MSTEITKREALMVAKYLLACAAAESASEYISPLRLQKLLYYTQGWSLATLGKPIFQDDIEAWTYGPVVPGVYQHYKNFGRSGIDPPDEVEDYDFDADEKKLIESVWDTYKEYSDVSLSKMTHSEPPWQEARRGNPNNIPSNETITLASMRKYFIELSESTSGSK